MADGYLSFVNTPWGHWLARTLGLPQPLPLQRYRQGQAGNLLNPVVLAAGSSGRLSGELQRIFAATETVAAVPASIDAPSTVKVRGLVFDASGLGDVQQLDELYRFFHANVRRLSAHGRVLVLGTPPEHCTSLGQTVAQRALEGFVRSLGKELRRAITAQLLYVEPGAEAEMDSSLRFFLSRRSAFVSGQVVRIAEPVDVPRDILWDKPLTGKRALVTGACRGIGLAIAQVLAGEGAQVVCLDIPAVEAELQSVAASFGGTALALDITAPQTAERLLAFAGEQGAFDIVVHNAGITRDKTIAKMTEAAWDSVIDVNLSAQERIDDLLLDQNVLHAGGRIIGVSSISGIAGNLGQTNYATSKAGVIGRVQSMMEPLRARGITINAVAPGFIETQMTARIPLGLREAGRRMNSMSQGGQPVDVAETIAWLASPACAGITGNVVRVCGQSLIGA